MPGVSHNQEEDTLMNGNDGTPGGLNASFQDEQIFEGQAVEEATNMNEDVRLATGQLDGLANIAGGVPEGEIEIEGNDNNIFQSIGDFDDNFDPMKLVPKNSNERIANNSFDFGDEQMDPDLKEVLEKSLKEQ